MTRQGQVQDFINGSSKYEGEARTEDEAREKTRLRRILSLLMSEQFMTRQGRVQDFINGSSKYEGEARTEDEAREKTRLRRILSLLNSVHHCGLEGWDRLNTNWRSIDASMDLWPNTN